MKARELRIGNDIKLFRKPEDKEMTNFKIKSIFYDDELECHYVELEDGFCVNIDKGIEPIPLTEEWLLKFGFEKLDDGTYKKLVTVWESLYIDLDINILQIGCNNREWFSFNRDITKVHKLQNLYYELSGEELTINETTKIK
jgi:hypothetical protein